ncbi:MAG TPA: hypothetical protein VHG92_15050 [Afifellaceae bacterium]|nr:hypothetical protein [Afifellaceae bacterium]
MAAPVAVVAVVVVTPAMAASVVVALAATADLLQIELADLGLQYGRGDWRRLRRRKSDRGNQQACRKGVADELHVTSPIVLMRQESPPALNRH